MHTWKIGHQQSIGESLLVKPEPTNTKDNKAVAVLKDDLVVGHVPYNLASRLFQFLRRDAFAEVTSRSESKYRSRLWT